MSSTLRSWRDEIAQEWLDVAVAGPGGVCVACHRDWQPVETLGRCYDCWRTDGYLDDLVAFDEYKASL